MLTKFATPLPRLNGWFNPFIQNRSFKEAERLSFATGIDHTAAWERAQAIKRGGHSQTPNKKVN